MDHREFRRLGHQLVDWIADYREQLEALPVKSPLSPGVLRSRFPAEAPRQGGGVAAALETLATDLLPGITHWNHPSFFAYFPSNTSYASVLADLLCAGLGVQGMSWATSPAATELEEVVMDWLRQLIGLPEAFAGVVQGTASESTLTALLCARERASRFAQQERGLSGGPALTVYASDQAHSSVEKGVLLAGLGRGNLRLIDSDDAYAMRPDLLERAIVADREAGRQPCAVIATTGTTATTALDPVSEIAELASRHGLWLHVDAALAGTAMVLPDCRWMWQGVERADSLVFNPHKWMGIGFDFSAYFVRDPQHLVRVMGMNPSYLHTRHDREVRNLRDWGIPLGRRFRALKAWFHLLDEGLLAMQARIRRDLDNASWLAAEIDRSAGWARLAPVPLQTVCFRHLVGGETDEAVANAHNLAIMERVSASGRAYLSGCVLGGRQAIRASVGALGTERRHVEAAWRELKEAAAALAPPGSAR